MGTKREFFNFSKASIVMTVIGFIWQVTIYDVFNLSDIYMFPLST